MNECVAPKSINTRVVELQSSNEPVITCRLFLALFCIEKLQLQCDYRNNPESHSIITIRNCVFSDAPKTSLTRKNTLLKVLAKHQLRVAKDILLVTFSRY